MSNIQPMSIEEIEDLRQSIERYSDDPDDELEMRLIATIDKLRQERDKARDNASRYRDRIDGVWEMGM